MSKQVLEHDEEYEDVQQGPNWTLIIVGYFAVLAVVITLLRPLHLTMGGIFFSMVIAGVVLALALFLVKRSIHAFAAQGVTVRQAVRAKYRYAIGYEGLPDEEDSEEQEQEPASFIADRDPLNLGERFKPSFRTFLCMNTLIVGTRRSGKSTLLLALIEEMARYGLPFVLFDTMGECSGLVSRNYLMRPRLAGNIAAMAIPEAARSLLANVTLNNAYNCGQMVMKHGLQLVVHLKSYNDDEAAIIMTEIVDGINDWQEARPNRERPPMMFFLSEGQKWFPQNRQDKAPDISSETQGLLEDAFVGKVVERGGKNGLGLVVETQRYSRLNKNLLQSFWKFYLRQSEEIDLARYKRQGIDPDEAKALQQGEVIAYGPDVDHFTFQCRRSYCPHEGQTPGMDALAKYTQELSKGPAQTDMEDLPVRGQNRGLEDGAKISHLSVIRASAQAPKTGPENDINPLAEQAQTGPDEFQAGPDDALLSGLQTGLLKVYYEDCRNVKKSLEQMGLSKRYQRHASYILEQCGLKKVKEA
jgi:hypothetical protein